MEFEIINEILTSTVANLFPNRSMHMSYFKSDEDVNKAEIPKSSNRKENHDSFAVEQWKQNEGRKKLEDAMARLKIDEFKIKNKDYLSFLSNEQLNGEKYKVKNELKLYDNEFQGLFRRMPNRSEKEIMRPLYMYYKNLKNAIDNKKVETNIKNSLTNSIAANNSSNNSSGSTNNKRNLSNNSFASKDNSLSESTPGSSNMYLFNNVYNKESEKKIIEKNEKKSQASSVSYSSSSQQKTISLSSKENNMKELGDDLFGGNVQKSNINSNINLSTMTEKQIKKLTDDLEVEYTCLKREQSDLKTRLHDYHHEFFQIHNRKVKYYKDIVPVENDYKKYKENKSRILEIQDLLMRIKKKTGHK